MGNKRQKLFFLQNISVKTLTKMLFYLILHENMRIKRLSGRDMQQYILKLTNNYWCPGNDTTYTLLNKMEQEDLVTSYWIEKKDNNKKVKRLYAITDKGLEEFKKMHPYFLNMFNTMINLSECALNFLYANNPEIEIKENIVMSSTLFQEINILQVLLLQNNYISGANITKFLSKRYIYWETNEGVLYPVLSNLASNKYVEDRWSVEELDGCSKKKTLREYIITSEGKKYLNYYKENTDLLSHLNQIRNMFILFSKL